MEELEKVIRVLRKLDPPPRTTCYSCSTPPPARTRSAQVEVFRERAGVTGLVMTKLDGTARGGILVAICRQVRAAGACHRGGRGR